LAGQRRSLLHGVAGAGPQIAREDHIDVLSVTDLPAIYNPLWAEYQRRRDPEDAALAEKTSTDAWIGTRRRLLHPSLFSDPSE